MSPPDNDLIEFIKDFIWAPLLALIAWAWNRNEKEHEMLKASHDSLRSSQSVGYSTLNDRVMGHVDERVDEVKTDHGKRLDKINDHIAKLFENAEKDRAAFRDALTSHSRDSQDRHIELLKAIHTGLAGKADK